MHWRRRLRDRWEQMTPEEHERLREGMRGHPSPRTTELTYDPYEGGGTHR
jgi:hypothetical protein